MGAAAAGTSPAYTEHMRSLFTNRRGILLLVTSLLLSLQIAGTHVHLCLDGQAPALQMHMVDAPAGHPTDHALQHSDRELSLAADTSLRDYSRSLDPPAPPPTELRVRALRAPLLIAVPSRATSPVLVSPLHDLLPPLRGPPLTAHA